MSRRVIVGVLISAAAAAVVGVRAAGESADVKAHIDAARKLAGVQWAAAADLFCATQEEVAAMHILPSANATDAAANVAEPVQVFDNLYFLGSKQVATWAITTPAGIIMIDSGYKDRVEDTLLAGMKKVGLNPADIRYVIIAHEHADHFGGAKYLQERYPALHVGMSAVAWDAVEHPQPGAASDEGPKRDLIVEEGKAITLGGEVVTPVAIPGHTPGSMAFIFEVRDKGKRHLAGLFGGTVLNPTMAIPFDEYEKSIEHWGEWTKKMHVDVELQNHPIMDRTFERMAELKRRTAAQENPFVVGQASVRNMVGVMSECAKAQLARRRTT
jgi:metallo-beta-lactamase class B